MTLRARLLGGLGLLVLVAVASSGWLVLRVARLELSNAQEADATTQGAGLLRLLSSVAAGSNAPLEDPNTRARMARVAAEWQGRGVVREVVVVKDGIALVGAPRPDDGVGAFANDPIVRRDGDDLSVYGAASGARGDRAAVRLTLPGEDLIARAVQRARWLVALAALLCAAAVLLFGAVWLERVVSAIASLAQAAKRVARGDLEGEAIVPSGGDELTALAVDFNAMTAALRRQRELVAAQADTLVAQEKLATVGRLAAGVAHEIGNPLAAISGFADMLRSDDRESDPARKLDMADRTAALERIYGEAARISAIIRELLDYSRPAKASLESVSLPEVVERAVSLVRPQPRFREVEVVRDLAPLRVEATPSHVEQILVNLLLNAADAMHGKGKVTVSAIELDTRVELSVEDSGPGVPQIDRDKIFDPFFTTKEPGHGTGLGLSVSLAIARAGGADLRLDGSDEGARFVLSLPRRHDS